jgi:muconolactone delta-isomerase
MRFLTKESFKAPPTAEVQALIPAELARTKELTEQGLLEAVYVAADRSGAWLIWNCESQAVLEETHKTLPLHEYLTSETTVLSEEM